VSESLAGYITAWRRLLIGRFGTNFFRQSLAAVVTRLITGSTRAALRGKCIRRGAYRTHLQWIGIRGWRSDSAVVSTFSRVRISDSRERRRSVCGALTVGYQSLLAQRANYRLRRQRLSHESRMRSRR